MCRVTVRKTGLEPQWLTRATRQLDRLRPVPTGNIFQTQRVWQDSKLAAYSGEDSEQN
jgi:hypothetical protein